MATGQNFEEHARLLIHPDTSMETRLQMVRDIRKDLEVTYTAEYFRFLQCYTKSLFIILFGITKPQFYSNAENKIRYIVIDILYRLPHIEVLRPFVNDILRSAIRVLINDNEEIALQCVRVVFDIFRHYRPPSSELQPFFDYVVQLHRNFKQIVTHVFESAPVPDPEPETHSQVPDPEPETHSKVLDESLWDTEMTVEEIIHPIGGAYRDPKREIFRSKMSFKMVVECPVMVMYLYQMNYHPVQGVLQHLVQLMIQNISIMGPKDVPASIMSHYIDMRTAQVKTLSFLSYFLREYSKYTRPHEEIICKGILNLFVNCPDSLSVRKELLVCLKHVINTDHKKALVPLLDTLLEERVLVGIDMKNLKELRPIAFSLLAELVHHIKWELSFPQLLRIISLFSINMHDSSWPLNIHLTCTRLMLNLVEPILEKSVDMEETRSLLCRVLDIFASKLSNFKQSILQDVLSSQVPIEHQKQVSDSKHLIKTLIMGIRPIIWTITNIHTRLSQVSSLKRVNFLQMLPPPSNSSVPRSCKGMKEDEVRKASSLLSISMDCLDLFKEKHEEREIIHHIAQIFTVMEPQDITDTFSLCMPHLFDSMISNHQRLYIFSDLQQAPMVFRPSAYVLVNFLVTNKLSLLNQHDSSAAKLVLHLFHFIFGVVAKYPSSYECILQPHLHVIFETCMKSLTENEMPLGYLLLLRTIFRALEGGKCELLMQDLIPKLHLCLNMLLAMLEGPSGKSTKDLLLELCFTYPGSLSTLLSHLPRLMKPLVMCLKGRSDQVGLGLRTLESWVDKLNPDFLESSMGNVIPEVILALWSHLRPAPYIWGGRSLQILGKLGGRNRRFLREPLGLECKENPEHGLRICLTFGSSTSFVIPLDQCINLAMSAIKRKNSGMNLIHRKQALRFLRVCLSSLLNLPRRVDESLTCRYLSTILTSQLNLSLRDSEKTSIKADLALKTRTQLLAENSLLKTLLINIIATSTEPDLFDTPDDYVASICHHFAILFYIENDSSKSSSVTAPLVDSSGGMSGCCSSSNLMELDPTIFLDAIVDVLADENRTYSRAALSTLNVFVETSLLLACSKPAPVMVYNPSAVTFGSPSPSVRVPVFEKLLPKLLHCCYASTWQAQIGGVIGIGALIDKVTLEILCLFQVKIVRGLVYVVRRLPLSARKEKEETVRVLMQVLRLLCTVEEAKREACRQSLQGVIEYLASELFNTNASTNVIDIVQSCMELLASRTGSKVSELLIPFYQPLLQPLITRKLHSRPVNQQVRIVAALNFCLSLQNPFIKVTQELESVLQEALEIAETEQIVSVVKSVSPGMVGSLIRLRALSIELLSSSIKREEFNCHKLSPLRENIISMFFKSLGSEIPEIGIVAKECIRQTICQRRISKELLQTNVRPILNDLKQIENLSVPFLQGLAHLLDLLSGLFTIALGGTLLLHLKSLLEPEKLAQCQKSWNTGEEVNIASAILEIFYHLPSDASKFLPEVVTVSFDLEAALPSGQFHSKMNSPYRIPLTKFLNRHPAVAVDYFLARLCQTKYLQCFVAMIKSDVGQPLRDELANSAVKILASAFPKILPQCEASVAKKSSSGSSSIDGIRSPQFDCSNTPATTLVEMSNSCSGAERTKRLQNEPELTLVQAKETKWLVKCFLNYLRHDGTECSVLFDMLSVFLFPTRFNYTFLKIFCNIEVAEIYSPNMKKRLLLQFLDIFRSNKLCEDHLVLIMQMLIFPILEYTFQNGQTWEVVDTTMIDIIFDQIIDPPKDVCTYYGETIRVELFHLSSLFLKYLPDALLRYRMKFFTFSWIHLKLEDCAIKQLALLNACNFFKSYNAPTKVILQVFCVLLRSCQPEYTVMVNQGLDMLLPVLPQRMLPTDSHVPSWIRCTKIILVEEGHMVPNMIHIFQLIVRHSHLFYKYRSLFTPLMVNSLSRLGLSSTATTESRKFAIVLAGLVISWERLTRDENKVPPEGEVPSQNGNSSADSDSRHLCDESAVSRDLPKRLMVKCMSSSGSSMIPNPESKQSVEHGEGFKLNAAMEEIVINFLIRVTCTTDPKDNEGTRIYKEALEILCEALDVWPCGGIKFDYLEMMLSSSQLTQAKDPAEALIQGLGVLNKILEKQPHIIIQKNCNHIFQIFEVCLKYKNVDAGNLWCSLLKMVILAYPLEAATTPQIVMELYTKVNDLIQKYLVAVATPHIANKDMSSKAISFVLYIIKLLAEMQDNLIQPYNVVHVLRHLAQELRLPTGSHDQRTRLNPALPSSQQGDYMGVINANLKSVLQLINRKVMKVPVCKQTVTETVMFLLSEKNTDSSVLLCLIDVIREWIEEGSTEHEVTNKPCNILSPKEVVSFLQSISEVHKQNRPPSFHEEWDKKYLQFLYELCSNKNKYPLSLCQEVFEKVERKFLLGMRAKNPEMRMKFLSLHDDALGRTLFIRLQYIFQIQDWEPVSDIFWLKQGLDLLFAVLVQDAPVMLTPTSGKVPSFLVSNLQTDSWMESMNIDVGETSKECPLVTSLVLKHVQFLSKMSQLQVSDLVVPLIELSQADPNVAYNLWVLLIPPIWMALREDEQLALAKPMVALLSKDYHKKQQACRPNVVQALLEGIQLCHPQPRLPSELIKYIGKTFNAWNIALNMLETHAMLFLNDSKCSESLDELYHLLHEEDMRCGLWRKRSVTAETRAGLSLVQHGYWQQAQSLFCQAMGKATRGTQTVSKGEMCLWEEQWLNCSRQLGQWDALADFGKLVENYDILLDSLWKQQDWTYLKDHLIPNIQVEETLKTHINKAYFFLHEKNTSAVEDTKYGVRKWVNLALGQWWQLPDICFQSRIPLLQQFQQLVEIQESARVVCIANSSQPLKRSTLGTHGQFAESKEILENWRVRTPNEWDDLSVWYDFLQWRNEIYSSVLHGVEDFGATNPQLDYVGYKDKAWNINKLAHVARKQGLHDVCVSILGNLYGHPAMDVKEAFVNIKEKLKTFLEMKGELINGLNLINSTNLEYLHAEDKAEIFRLKGNFLLRLNDSDGANTAYSNAISLCKNLPKGWISWGNYCEMAYKKQPDEIWLEYAVSCFLQGIKYGISNSRSHLARVIYLLSFDTPKESVGRAFDKYLDQIPHWLWLYWIPQLLISLQRTEAPHCKLVLLKIAFYYPQALYYSLRTYLLELHKILQKFETGRTEMSQQNMQLNVSSSGSDILSDGITGLASQRCGPLASDSRVQQGGRSSGIVEFPHGRSSYMQEPDSSSVIQDGMHAGNHIPLQHSASTITDSNLNSLGNNDVFGLNASAVKAYDAAKDIMGTLQNKHTNLASELEVFCTEIGSRFVPQPEERLFKVISTVLRRCYSQPYATTGNVPEFLKKELSNIRGSCFAADSTNKHVDFVKKYKQKFDCDLDPESTATFPASLCELIKRLKQWKNVVQTNMEEQLPAVLKLEEESKVLSDFHLIDVEIPGQYFVDQEVAPSHTVKLDRIKADVSIERRHGNSFRRLTLIGSDGSKHHFAVTAMLGNTRSDERIIQFFRAMNKMFDKHKESRRRHICVHTPIIIPVCPQVCMVEDDPKYNTYLEVYEHYCLRNGRDADLPVTYFKEQLDKTISGQMSAGSSVELRLKAYSNCTINIIDSIFSKYMYKTLSNVNHMWAFKRQFTIQLALSCFLSYVLHIGGRSPDRILFAKNSGKVFQTDFHPVYNDNGIIDFNEPIPFRLTRNFLEFISHFGVEGVLVSSISSAAQAVVSPKQSQHLWHHLALFFRDELFSWSWRRFFAGYPLLSGIGEYRSNPAEFMQKILVNIERVSERINSLAPQHVTEKDHAVEPPQSVHIGVTKLVDAATAPRNLCMTDPTWHPWF
ncbi:Histone acetyltransferase SAGA, TRRAP/TRA1 component, PI-3 kinase superfamily [Heracleum sosnowskyi]|uniref:Histone acetyltransferase SAGA, TRRAP/TRA1 component, PI-3 kinase superfamily n=1 Tax=Heracleum sosnowskyi TaxID=360622 RepID=A0AAD8HC25_9APIA|nr:Histone acetyltransferase SAGA, TRRAP/TRA1 component, PI-3 kinase superfamily [Heracleum sosnowskyi]